MRAKEKREEERAYLKELRIATILEAAEQANRLMFFLARDEALTSVLSEADMEELFGVDPVAYHTKHVDTIFQRVFGQA